jgi:hypothetical protein
MTRTPTDVQQHAGTVAERLRALEDAILDSYARWREACEDVRSAYKAWHGSSAVQRDPSFEGFRAALNWEEQMARVHADRTGELRAVRLGAS